jgi:uncharacterized sulfatase
MKSLLPALAAACTLLASAAFAAPAAAAASEKRQRPNIVFITCDDLNTALGAYGHPQVKSPRIDGLAARGARFEQAFAQWPSCQPSRYSMLSGWSVPRTGMKGAAVMSRTGPLANAVYLPQHLKSIGYETIRLDKIFHIGGDDPASWTVSEEPMQMTGGGAMVANWTGIELQALGLDGVHEKSFAGEPYSSPVVETGRFDKVAGEKGPYTILRDDVPEERLFDGHTAARAVHHLERLAASGQPFFMGVGFRRPHLPFIAQKRYFDLYPWEQIELPPAQPGFKKPFSDEDHKKLIRGYYASISFVDVQVGKVLDALERLGLADNTYVVLLGDHGYALGEREGWFSKGRLWDSALRTSLLVAGPGIEPRAVPTVVGLIDLYPTLVDLVRAPAPATPLDGHSLVSLLDDRIDADSARPAHVISHDFRGGWKSLGVSVRTATHRYVENGDGTVELIDVVADPYAWKNLAADPAHAALRAELSALARRALPAADAAKSPDEPLL